MKFGQVLAYNKKSFFSSKNHAENKAVRPVPDLFFSPKNPLFVINASGVLLSFNIVR